MTEPAIFFRLLRADNKANALREAVTKVNDGESEPSTHHVDLETFDAVPDSAFAYWVSDRVREIFRKLPKFEGSVGEARQGLATADDFRFVRARWEVPEDRIARSREQTVVPPRGEGKRWVAFAKGGEFSPYWSDIHLLVNWWNDGEELRRFTGPGGRLLSRPQNVDFFFRPGLTWPLRTQAGLSFRAMPAGCAFGHKGPAIVLFDTASGPLILALTNARAFRLLVELQMAFGSYEVGVIQRTPWPVIPATAVERLTELGQRCHDLTRRLATTDETTLAFVAPLLARPASDLKAAYLGALGEAEQIRVALAEASAEADRLVLDLYEIDPEDHERIDRELGVPPGTLPRTRLSMADDEFQRAYCGTEDLLEREDADDEGEEREQPRRARRSYRTLDRLAQELGVHPAVVADRRRELGLFREDEFRDAVQDLLMYCVGCAFGRWDVRIATDRARVAPLPGAFDPLPLLAPGRLSRADGQSVERDEIPTDYPIASVARTAVLSDADLTLRDGRSGDLVMVVGEALTCLFGERAAAIESEAAESLGVRDLRVYFRTRFFAWHLGRYSKSRRKTPIYWPLQSDRKSLTLWFYAPRVDAQTLYVAIKDFVEPKILSEERRLRELRQQREAADVPRREQVRLDREIDRQQELLAELGRFKASLEGVAALGYDPDPDDGILINAAPMREMLLLWPEARRMWQQLLAGRYAWSRMSARLKARGLVRETTGG